MLDNNGEIKIPTSGSSLYNVYSASDFIRVSGLTTIRMNQRLSSGNWGAFYDKDKNFISGIDVDGYESGASVPDGAYYARLTVNNEVLDTFAVNVGDTLLDYEPYRPVQTVTITSDRPITKWDKLDKRNGVYGWAYKGLKLTVDGQVNWDIYNGDYAGFYAQSVLPELMNRREGYCNQLRIDTKGGVLQNGLWIGVNSKVIYAINNDYYDNSLADKGLANWKAHLNENPLIIWTYSDTETWVPLSQAEQDALNALTAYYPNTTVTNDQGVTMEVDYVADTKNYIDNKFAELQAAILATGANI